MYHSKTISIFLESGSPNGIKILEIANRTIRAYVIPRIKLPDTRGISALGRPSLYILLDSAGEKAYIGEAEKFSSRIDSHVHDKDFWDMAICFVATNNSLEKSDIKFLESIAVERAKRADRMTIENKNIPARNNLHEFKVPAVEEFFDDVELLTTTLGYPLFDKVEDLQINSSNTWYCRGRNADAKGVYGEEGFTVLEGSIINADPAPSFAPSFPKRFVEWQQEVLRYTERLSEKSYRVHTRVTFNSVSRASDFCLGRSSNGWTEWKNSNGQTLDEVIRRSVDA